MAPAAPLSHHEILERVAPFARAGYTLDLPASDRAARRLAFKPVAHAAAADRPALVETLHLQDQGGDWQLTRELTGDAASDAPPARLTAEGADPEALLQGVMAVPVARQFLRAEPGDAESPLAVLTQQLGPGGQLVLRQASAHVAGFTLRMKVSSVRGYPAQLDLLKTEGDRRTLPEDLLEVQGRAWTRLTALRQGWDASMQLQGTEPARSADAEAKLRRTLQHLQRTLSEPPARFHQRHRAARWRIGLLRGGPLLFGLVFVAAAFALRGRGGSSESTLAALANLAPPLLMALFFMRREMPRIELPRWPRQPPASSWPGEPPKH
jgi:hypothetical protein